MLYLSNPKSFKEFVGQNKIKNTLKIMINASKKQSEIIDNLLFCGGSGFGKTTLAKIVSKELKSNVKVVQGPILEKKADILSLFASLKSNDVLFIDEVHGINKQIEELLYSAMDERKIDLLIGPDGDSKIVRMNLPKFHFICATTKMSSLSNPLINRFGYVAHFENYSDSELIRITKFYLKKRDIAFDEEICEQIYKHCLRSPREIKKIIKRINDYLVAKDEVLSLSTLKKLFKVMGINKYGLNQDQIRLLKLLQNSDSRSSNSVKQIASMLSVDITYLEESIEPDLLHYNLIYKSSRGRKITEKGIKFLIGKN